MVKKSAKANDNHRHKEGYDEPFFKEYCQIPN